LYGQILKSLKNQLQILIWSPQYPQN